MLNSTDTILALDVGARRIGVASANPIARIARPLTTLEHGEDIVSVVHDLVVSHKAAMVVVGLPRGLSGQETQQTQSIRAFGAQLAKVLTVPLHWQDEALTSRKAEDELQARGKPYVKGDIDALAAAYILEDFLQDNPEVRA